MDATFRRLSRFLPGGVALFVDHLYVSGDTAVVEMHANATDLRGEPFDNVYCWVCRFQGDVIVEVRAYVDTELVQAVFDANERLPADGV